MIAGLACKKDSGTTAVADVPKDQAIPGILINSTVNHNQFQQGTFEVTGIKINNSVTVPLSGSEYRYKWSIVGFYGHELPTNEEAFRSIIIPDSSTLKAGFKLAAPRAIPNGAMATFRLDISSNETAYKGYYVVIFDDSATNVVPEKPVTQVPYVVDPISGQMVPALSETVVSTPGVHLDLQRQQPVQH